MLLACAFSKPRSRNWRKPRACLICLNTGSGSCLRSRTCILNNANYYCYKDGKAVNRDGSPVNGNNNSGPNVDNNNLQKRDYLKDRPRPEREIRDNRLTHNRWVSLAMRSKAVTPRPDPTKARQTAGNPPNPDKMGQIMR